MKIERLNENQIRCTLSKEDLVNRELKISELAYGSDKAKKLFRDMMMQASNEVGFEANDIPLVIEAIPVSSECIVLIVTKVDDPEELDTRFSRFSPSNIAFDDDDTVSSSAKANAFHSAADILDLFKKISDELLDDDFPETDTPTMVPNEANNEVRKSSSVNLKNIFCFHHLDDICRYAKVICTRYHSANTLYKDASSDTYYLVLSKGKASPELFNKICNIASEYGEYVPATDASIAYYNEHYKIILKNKAIQKLANL